MEDKNRGGACRCDTGRPRLTAARWRDGDQNEPIASIVTISTANRRLSPGVPDQQGGASMLSVMIFCPTAERQVYTGIDTDEASFDRLPEVSAHTRCPICGEVHLWTKRKAWLAESVLANLKSAA